MNVLTPKQTVEQLDKYIIGQDEAKRTVAIALRNRYRRSRLPEEMREEIIPKNIIMVGPTGVGKTEIARRLAKLVDAPFVKVEATKFTEVGYVGRDVDSMIRDLVEASIRLVKAKRTEQVRLAADAAAEKRIVDILCGKPAKQTPNPADSFSDGLAKLFGSLTPGGETGVAVKKNEPTEEQTAEHISKRNKIISDLQAGRLEDEMIEIEVAETATGNDTMLAMGIDLNLNEMFGGVLPKKTKARKVTVRDARRILSNEESEKLVDMDAVVRDAIDKAEQDGIVFIDEIDKIAAKGAGSGPDVSREGVQRDILPIVEGSVVSTKYGPVRTNYMLFIAAGAFHVSKINDLIPELQGRFPIVVKLNALTTDDYERILTAPQNAITKQYAALLETDNIRIEFKQEALRAVAEAAFHANETGENIGARRLHTIIENLLEEALLFCGCKDDEDNQAKVSREYQTRIGLGQDGYLGSETNKLNQLNTLLEEGNTNINKQFGAKFTINATGDTEEEAYAQCDAQAKQKYEEQSASIKAALVALQTSFNTKKAELLPSFTEDEKNKYYINDVAYGMVSYQKSIAIAPGYEDIYIVEDTANQVTFKAGKGDVQ